MGLQHTPAARSHTATMASSYVMLLLGSAAVALAGADDLPDCTCKKNWWHENLMCGKNGGKYLMSGCPSLEQLGDCEDEPKQSWCVTNEQHCKQQTGAEMVSVLAHILGRAGPLRVRVRVLVRVLVLVLMLGVLMHCRSAKAGRFATCRRRQPSSSKGATANGIRASRAGALRSSSVAGSSPRAPQGPRPWYARACPGARCAALVSLRRANTKIFL